MKSSRVAPIAAALLACWAALQRRGKQAPHDAFLNTYFVSATDATWRAVGSGQVFELRFEAAAAAEWTSAVSPQQDGMHHSAVLSSRFLQVGLGSARGERVGDGRGAAGGAARMCKLCIVLL